MRKILVAGNWKMHGSTAMTHTLVSGILTGIDGSDFADIAVFPASPYLAQVGTLARDSLLRWGAQDVNPNDQGAHTGEVDCSMLQDMGCTMVLVGHSERRSSYADTDELVAEKFASALASGLVPVLCVGETLEERQAGRTMEVINRQLDAVLNRTGVEGFANAILAYEPVWAIGTGETASPDQAQQIHANIRTKFGAMNDTISLQIRILYGGSVKGSNAAELFAQPDIDGGLIGGASLRSEDFLAIYNAARR